MISMRSLLHRRGVDREIISFRNALANHPEGTRRSLSDANRLFLQPADGIARGCHTPSQTVSGKLAVAVPSWVAVKDSETRTLEGVLVRSKVTHTDFPLKPWHTYYDWNFDIILDPQYTYLVLTREPPADIIIECEWDTAFLPNWAWPQQGQRIWMVGRWIYDCGHPGVHGYKTEIHPPKAIAAFRSEAVQFSGNAGPTAANLAVVYIGRNGGYWQHAINDQNYAFDLYLPPQPYSEAVPCWEIIPQTGALPALPQIMHYPADQPRALRVVIPLEGLTPQPEEYGVIIAAGWTDPQGTASAQIQHLRVQITTLFMDGEFDGLGDGWYVYIGVNGRWRIWENIDGSEAALDFTVELDLHPDDQICITACGFQADLMHYYMGKESGFTWAQISDKSMTESQLQGIEDTLLLQLATSLNRENLIIGYLFRTHPSSERGTFTIASETLAYRLRYTIENR